MKVVFVYHGKRYNSEDIEKYIVRSPSLKSSAQNKTNLYEDTIGNGVDIFDFEKYAEEYELMGNYFKDLELYLKTALLIDYKYNYLSKANREVFEVSLNKKKMPKIAKIY
jgi:hypothetical protein